MVRGNLWHLAPIGDQDSDDAAVDSAEVQWFKFTPLLTPCPPPIVLPLLLSIHPLTHLIHRGSVVYFFTFFFVLLPEPEETRWLAGISHSAHMTDLTATKPFRASVGLTPYPLPLMYLPTAFSVQEASKNNPLLQLPPYASTNPANKQQWNNVFTVLLFQKKGCSALCTSPPPS